ncbi:MAG: succinyldiaminopimelate transaminase [Rhodocyclaceae bacterium]|nr:succinyldiaminopimelate transaminase [Rhodocyclaceae bacterium]
MNPDLAKLQPYPFEKLRAMLASGAPATPSTQREIRLGIGEPQHATPEFIKQALCNSLAGLANYPTTQGDEKLRVAISEWIARRYKIAAPNPATQILPVNGSREALFSFAQAVVDRSKPGALVVSPNPFYQIYEGAAYLAGATPVFLNNLPENDFNFDYQELSEQQWQRVQLLFVCSPGNPTGKVLTLDDWKELFALSDKYGFIIAADECYSEIYFDEAAPPLGALEAARKLGRDDYRRLVVFSSLSKRSNVPGLRSGFVAGDANVMKSFLLYRTYHGSAMNPAVQATSVIAWQDEAHVIENRRLYKEKFDKVTPLIAPYLKTAVPDAGFYLWASVANYAPIADEEFTRRLQHQYNVGVLPGSYLAREANGVNPGAGFVRLALVASLDDCLEAAGRIADFCKSL